MKLEIATKKAIQFACTKYHYSKSYPVNTFGFSVFNDKNEFCGCIVYGSGATPNIAKPYKLKQGQVIELVRVALNGKQESTSKAVAISLRLLPKYIPYLKLVVSYADVDQNHTGVIYQAMNWYYEGHFNAGTRSAFIINGKKVHPRNVYSLGVKQSLKSIQNCIDPNASEFISKGKHKYIYPISKDMVQLCKMRHKAYPKRA